jgi:4a-hydroxytetrahydrobiopterin dehydratase
MKLIGIALYIRTSGEKTMNQLTQSKCTACRKGEPTVTAEEIAEFRPQVPDWSILEVKGVKRLEKEFRFDNFVHALAFTNNIGELAEEEGHHPALLTEWGKVTVSWWTHKIGGLHRNDFIMAAKSDQAYAMAEGRKE